MIFLDHNIYFIIQKNSDQNLSNEVAQTQSFFDKLPEITEYRIEQDSEVRATLRCASSKRMNE